MAEYGKVLSCDGVVLCFVVLAMLGYVRCCFGEVRLGGVNVMAQFCLVLWWRR